MKHLPIRSYLVGALLAAASTSSAWALELNAASTVDLVNIGVSRNVAQKIVAHHKLHGDFQSTNDLLNVPGVTVKTVNRLSNKLTINGAPVGASNEAPSPGVAPAKPAASNIETGSNSSVSTDVNTGVSAGVNTGVGVGVNTGASTGVSIGGNAGVSVGGGIK
jgi:hypothetical protein